MIDKLPYDMQFAVICFLPPEDVVKLKPWIHQKEYDMYFDQEYIKVYACKEHIKNAIYAGEHTVIDKSYLDNLIRCGLKLGIEYDYSLNRMNNEPFDDDVMFYDGEIDEELQKRN